jgi:hypothetical protein
LETLETQQKQYVHGGSMLKDIRLFEERYLPATAQDIPAQRINVLKYLVGVNLEDGRPFSAALKLAPADKLWRTKNADTDFATVLQRERMSAHRSVRTYMGGNLRESDRELCYTALIRLLLAEALPETLRPFTGLHPRRVHVKLSERIYDDAQAVFEVMLPERLGITEVKLPGIGITRQGLGILMEDTHRMVKGGGF